MDDFKFGSSRPRRSESYLLRLTPAEHEALKQLASEQGRGIADVIRDALDHYMQSISGTRKSKTKKPKTKD